MRVGILGSGFGLYGYLPALLLECDTNVLIPKRYRQKLLVRSDTAKFSEKVVWLHDESAVISEAEALVISQRPEDQVRWATECLSQDNVAYILLEKPVAADPITATLLINQLANKQKAIRVGYTFRYTKWGQELLKRCRETTLHEPLEFEWHFRAHHYAAGQQNWKRRVSKGGGALRFFGIHLIALLAEMGYEAVLTSKTMANQIDEAEQWTATFMGYGLPHAQVRLDSNSPCTRFYVKCGKVIADLVEPFEIEPTQNNLDRRVSGLGLLCRDLLQAASGYPNWYQKSIDLWYAAETAV